MLLILSGIFGSMFDPVIIVIGVAVGAISRAWWQAVILGFVIGTLVIATLAYYFRTPGVVPIMEGPGAAIWALGIFWLQRTLRARKAAKANSN